MPTVRVVQEVARTDGSFAPGEVVTGDVARDALAGGWGEVVDETPETPEGTAQPRGRRRPRPETRG